uniref:Guided entry of tail-anchored proteins factor 1 n=1 Tax=Hirondellea gigas TaxID=1518452 RepID=A0A6A7FZ31_9CRUS
MALAALIVATLVACSGCITSPLKQFLSWLMCAGVGVEEKRLLQEVSSLRRRLQNISMADQFAAWAKLQRQINAITQTYQNKASERQRSDERIQGLCSTAVTFLVSAASVWYVWCSYGSAAIELPPPLLSPLASLLAVPGCQPGEVSVVVWLACVRSVMGRLTTRFGSKKTGAPASLQALWPLLNQLVAR